MSELQLKIGQLEINPDQPQNWLVKVFVAKSSPAKEKALGKLFGAIEVKFKKQVDENFLDNLAKCLKNNYYQLTNEVDNASLETIFEQALKKTNSEIGDLIQPESGLDIKNFNAVIGVIRGQELHFAPVGAGNIFLIHYLSHNNYKLINILETTRNVDVYPAPTKIFSNIVSGELAENDSLLLANTNFLDYLSLDKIKKVTSSLPAGSAAEQFKSLLLGVNHGNIFGALILKLAPIETKPIARPPQELSPQNSIAELISTETNTEKLLNSSMGLNFGKYFKKIRLPNLPGGNISAANSDKISYAKGRSWPMAIIRRLGKMLVMSGYLLWGLLNLLTRPRLRSEQENPFFNWIDQRLQQFKGLPGRQRLLLVATFIFIVIFSQGVVFLSQRQNNQVEQHQYDQLLSQISDQQNAAEASLIYKDEERARQLLLEVRDLIGALPQNTRQRRKDYLTLSANVEKLLAKTKKIIQVDQLTVLADLSEPALNLPSPKQIILAGQRLLTYTQGGNTIYEMDVAAQKAKKLNIVTGPITRLEWGNLLAENSLLFYTGDGFVKLNLTDNTLSPVAVDFSNETNARIKDFMIYNRRLYILDTANNQIYKYEPTEGGFGSGSAWLKSKLNLSDAVSLGINGNTYVLKSSGAIDKFLRGLQQDFALDTLEPVLNQPTKIWTDIDSEYLYLLDPSNKRLVVLDKDGKLQAQYFSEQFNDLKDFAVSETQNKIYLLNGSQVLEIPMSHKG